VLAHLEDIDQRLTASADNWRLPRMATVDRNVLRLGAYELLFTQETPPAVAFDEAIELAPRYGSADPARFVHPRLGCPRPATPAPASRRGSRCCRAGDRRNSRTNRINGRTPTVHQSLPAACPAVPGCAR